MSTVPAELAPIEWLSDEQLAAVDGHQLVSTAELLGRPGAAVPNPWLVRLRETAHERIEEAVEQTWRLAIRAQRLAHDLQKPADLRHHSQVAHHLGLSFDEVVEALTDPIVEAAGGVQLRCGPGLVTTRPARFEAEGTLRLPASYPELPVRLSVEPWWRNRCVVGLSLRASRRIRYPRRYFVSAHRVLAQLAVDSGWSGAGYADSR
jgi:hypothetical protein